MHCHNQARHDLHIIYNDVNISAQINGISGQITRKFSQWKQKWSNHNDKTKTMSFILGPDDEYNCVNLIQWSLSWKITPMRDHMSSFFILCSVHLQLFIPMIYHLFFIDTCTTICWSLWVVLEDQVYFIDTLYTCNTSINHVIFMGGPLRPSLLYLYTCNTSINHTAMILFFLYFFNILSVHVPIIFVIMCNQYYAL